MRHPSASRGTAVTPSSNAWVTDHQSNAGRGTTTTRATSTNRGTTQPRVTRRNGSPWLRRAPTVEHTATRATNVQRVSNAKPSMQLLIRAPPPAAKIREVRAVCSSALSAPACNQDKRGKSYMSERPQRPAYSQSQL